MDSPSDIRDIAAQWIARRTGDSWSEADEADLQRWLDASTSHRIAYLRLAAAWQEADRLKVLGAGIARGAVPNLEDFRVSPFFRHVHKSMPGDVPDASTEDTRDGSARGNATLRRIAVATSLLAVVGLGFWAWTTLNAGTAYSTAIGVTAAVPLSDGSKITLNTDSEIRVAVTENERRVELEHGEAYFEVVPDPVRPFTVNAGEKRIVVLGTKFSVRHERGDVRVVVMEGKVRVSDTPPLRLPGVRLLDPPPGVAGKESPIAEAVVLPAGSVARAIHGRLAVQERTLPEVRELLSWRSGYIAFHETSLADAVAEFNRYNSRRLVIEDPQVAAFSISGNFRATNVVAFARLLEEGFPIAVVQEDERIVLKSRQQAQ